MHSVHGLKRLMLFVALGGAVTFAESKDESVELRLKWEVGKRYVMRIENSQEMEITLMPGTAPMHQAGQHSFDLSVATLKALPDGGRELEMSYLEAAFEMNMGGQTVSFDSRSDDTVDADNPLAVISKMVGAKIVCRLDGEGQIKEVEGLKEFAARMTEGNPQVAQVLEGFLNTESFKRNFGGYFGMHWLPGKRVKIGETWSVEDEVPMGALGTFVNRMDYTFEGWENGHAVLVGKGTMSSRPGKPIEQGGMSMDLAVKNGNIAGRTLVDPRRGTVTESSLETMADMQITVKGMDGATGPMDQKLKQKYTAKLIRVEDIPSGQ